jgi:hypothetical protein
MPILLLHKTLIIFQRRASSRERNLFLFTIGDDYLIDELATVVGIDSQDRKREERPRALDGCQNRHLSPVQQGQTFRPPGGYVGECQRVQVAALNVGATMGYKIRWKSSRVGSHSTPRTYGSGSVA